MEYLMDWIPAISTTALLSLALWFGRNLITTRLTNSVRHEFDTKLANLKADLRSKELQLESLKNTALNGIALRQSALFSKQVKAIETLWSQVIDFLPAKGAAQNMAFIKFDSSLELASEDPKVREMFMMLGGHVELDSVDFRASHKLRPFISPVAWAYFTAYTAILSHALLKFHLLKKGLNYPDFIENNNLKKVIVTALPHQKKYVEKVDSGAYYHLLDELESLMLLAFENTLKGVKEDKEALSQAADLIKVSENLINKDKLDQHSA
jgi:hypothetical protein